MSIEVGAVVEGTVTGITNFGAFIELPGGKVGLVHISEVADVYVRDVKDFLKERDKVQVKVLSIDANGKIGLSIKQLQPRKFANHLPLNHVVRVRWNRADRYDRPLLLLRIDCRNFSRTVTNALPTSRKPPTENAAVGVVVARTNGLIIAKEHSILNAPSLYAKGE